ncbi:hypothetical protein LJC23_04295 [Desulfovibrio sp. OttesenSCG-928-I05]|nr:hypothetical protein [Desulfovibrio sp. OttesenSCG-928-I05]
MAKFGLFGGGEEQPSAKNGAEWAFLPDGLESLKEGFERPEEFWGTVSRALGMLREKIQVTGMQPDGFLDEADSQALWRKLGKPERADGYQFPEAWRKENVPADILERVNETLRQDRNDLMQICHTCDLTDKQAKKLFECLGELLVACFGEEGQEQNEDDAQQKLQEALQKLWPDATDAHKETIMRGVNVAGIGKELDESELTFEPLMLKLLHVLGEATGEDAMRGKNGYAAGLPSGEAARQEMYSIIRSDAYRKNDPAAMRRVEALATRIKR